MHITGNECQHSIEWHSPYSCSKSQTNYEHPCYVYDPQGRLIDLTHLVLSNGSSYEIESGNFNTTIKKFHLNVCNEASEQCAPNVSSCRLGDKSVETGYNNLTSVKYDSKDESVNLVSLGEFNEKCESKRVKTVVKFLCPKQYNALTKPKLVSSDDCDNIIEWSTIRACPVPDVQEPATNCEIKYEPLGIDINLKEILTNESFVEVSDMNVNGKNKTMILSICQGISLETYRCANKSSRGTSACLLEGSGRNSSEPSKSEILGTIAKTTIKLEDSRLLIESYAPNKTCEVPVSPGFNYTRQLSTRIEVVCAEKDEPKPKFVAFEDCVYLFEWASSEICLENMINQPQVIRPSNSSFTPKPIIITPSNGSLPVPTHNQSEDLRNPDPDEASNRTAHDLHKDTVADSKRILKPEEISPSQITNQEPKKDSIVTNQSIQPTTKMNRAQKFFMIGLIVMSLTAFVVVIFILDRKTNFKIPLGRIGRRARQAFRPQPVPYSRVSFNDNLDL